MPRKSEISEARYSKSIKRVVAYSFSQKEIDYYLNIAEEQYPSPEEIEDLTFDCVLTKAARVIGVRKFSILKNMSKKEILDSPVIDLEPLSEVCDEILWDDLEKKSFLELYDPEDFESIEDFIRTDHIYVHANVVLGNDYQHIMKELTNSK